MHNSQSDTKAPDVAFYYPGWIWHDVDSLKNLLLFFDGIALLVPAYMRDEVDQVDPELTIPLLDAGFLHILEPEELVDKAATEKLAHSLANILDTGALEPLANGGTRFHELSYSRLGGFGDRRLADGIIRELKARGLAKDSEGWRIRPIAPAGPRSGARASRADPASVRRAPGARIVAHHGPVPARGVSP